MSVLFVGPLPPPVHGFSAINAAMLTQLQQHAATMSVFNRASPPKSGRSAVLWHWFKLVARYAATVRHARTAYVGLSGGTGQLLDLPFVALARLRGCKIYMHHHSFSYLNTHSRLTKWVLRAAGTPHHIVLGNVMGLALQEQYGVAPDHITVLSNSAFLSEADDAALPKEPNNNDQPRQPVIGYLSNITAEKGIFDFLAALAHLRAAGQQFQARIAGPVDPAIQARFAAELAKAPEAIHLGPVYGADKAAFFQSLDILVFPTRYINEAEPVTIHEALQAGASVIAAERGCIPSMVLHGCGQVVSIDHIPAALLGALIAHAQQTPEQHILRRQHIVHSFKAARTQHRHTLAQLISAILS